MTNASLRLLVVAGVLVMVVAALTSADNARASEQSVALLDQIDDLRDETWRWQGLMRLRLTPTSYSERTAGEAYRVWVRDLWQARAERAEAAAQDPPHERDWRCIHRYEAVLAGGWDTSTGNGYYGGLQMSMTFQRTLAPELLRAKAPPTTGRRSSRCGWPSARSGAVTASRPGRTRPAAAACSSAGRRGARQAPPREGGGAHGARSRRRTPRRRRRSRSGGRTGSAAMSITPATGATCLPRCTAPSARAWRTGIVTPRPARETA